MGFDSSKTKTAKLNRPTSLSLILHLPSRHSLRPLKDHTPTTRGHQAPQGHRGLQSRTWLSPHTRAATIAVHLVPQSRGTATRHMAIPQNSLVGYTNICTSSGPVLVLCVWWLCFWLVPPSVFMVEQNHDSGNGSRAGSLQSFLSACSATLCCCCLWNLLGQCF